MVSNDCRVNGPKRGDKADKLVEMKINNETLMNIFYERDSKYPLYPPHPLKLTFLDSRNAPIYAALPPEPPSQACSLLEIRSSLQQHTR